MLSGAGDELTGVICIARCAHRANRGRGRRAVHRAVSSEQEHQDAGVSSAGPAVTHGPARQALLSERSHARRTQAQERLLLHRAHLLQ